MAIVGSSAASRWAFRATVLIAAAFALYRYSWLPYRANHVLFAVERRSEAAEGTDPLRGMPVARANIAMLESVEAGCRTDVNYHMLYAANARVLRRPDLARQHYDAALALDRRPELFLQRGFTALESGDVNRAVADFVQATRFNPALADELEGGLRDRVQHEASRH
jgi:tetratricopeptide (TPR) repeat protein